MYDTIIFPTPIACNTCGKLHKNTQTKLFSNFLANYGVGDVLPTNIVSGIVEETIYCEHKGDERYFTQKIFLVVWNKILIDVLENTSEAEKKLETFKIKNLQELYEKLFEQKIDFSTKYSRLKRFVKKYSEYLSWPQDKQEKFKDKDSHTFLTIPDLDVIEHLKKEFPLMSYVEELDGLKFKEKGMF